MDNTNNVDISNSNIGSNNEIGNMTIRDNISVNYVKLTKELNDFETESKNAIHDNYKNELNKEIKELKEQVVEAKRTGFLDRNIVITKFKNIYNILSKKIDTTNVIRLFSTIPTWLSYLKIEPQDFNQAFL